MTFTWLKVRHVKIGARRFLSEVRTFNTSSSLSSMRCMVSECKELSQSIRCSWFRLNSPSQERIEIKTSIDMPRQRGIWKQRTTQITSGSHYFLILNPSPTISVPIPYHPRLCLGCHFGLWSRIYCVLSICLIKQPPYVLDWVPNWNRFMATRCTRTVGN